MRVQGCGIYATMTFGASRPLGQISQLQLPGHVGPRRGDRLWNSLLYLCLRFYLSPKNCLAHRELTVCYGEIKGAAEQSGRRLCDQLSLCEDWYVCLYGGGRMKFVTGSVDKAKAIAQFEQLCEALANVGLQTEVRNGESHSILLFVRVASDEHLFGEVYRSRYAYLPILSGISTANNLQSPRLDPWRTNRCSFESHSRIARSRAPLRSRETAHHIPTHHKSRV